MSDEDGISAAPGNPAINCYSDNEGVFIVFIWFVIEIYLWPGTIDIVLWASSCLLALKCLTGYLTIRRRM